jgi:metal-responsive CopG/Arc/MetJ family transcriptional regulator
MKNALETITVRLPKDLKDEVEQLCDAESIGTSTLVREALKHYLAFAQYKKIRSELLPLAEKAGILTDEDVFEIQS